MAIKEFVQQSILISYNTVNKSTSEEG